MNTRPNKTTYFGLLIAGLLAACSGGGINISTEGPVIPQITPVPPISISEAITTHGVITGLNDVTVNNVRYSAISANITFNGRPGTMADLQRGQVITLRGTINGNGATGTADSIRFDANLIGPVESLDAAGGRLIVMGQTVLADADTIFAAGIDPATFSGLSVGDNVRVSGYANSAGAIRATRIDPAGSNIELQLIGQVAGIDLANYIFTIDRLTLDYSNALVIDLPAGAPAIGLAVMAHGTMSNGLFIVERLVSAPQLAGTTGQRVQAAGLITRFNSPNDFEINGRSASVGAAATYINGDSSNLTLNAELVLDGDFASGGRITANRITFGQLVSDIAALVYDFENFTAISVPTVFNVVVNQGPEFSVEVLVDEEAANRVQLTQFGTRLDIALTQGDGNIDTLEAFVTMPVLDQIDLTGVANATLNNFSQSQLTVNVGGVSRVHGNALAIDNLTASVTGVSQLGFGDIRPIGNANIQVSGVSLATLNMGVGSTLTGSVSTGQGTGASTLFYYGTNVNVNVTTDFLSTVVKLGETRP